MTENKKVVKAVSGAVSKSAKEIAVFKAGSKNFIKNIKKEWKKGEPKRKELEAKTGKAIKEIKKSGNEIVKKSSQLKNDITKGVKRGLK